MRRFGRLAIRAFWVTVDFAGNRVAVYRHGKPHAEEEKNVNQSWTELG